MRYLFLIFDGLKFFSFDDNKIERLKGKEIKCYDKLKNKRWVVFNSLALIVIVFIISDRLKELGKIKNQTITY